MHFSTILFALATPFLASVSAAPVRRAPLDPINAVVFNFAHTLELLESEFYTQALAKFSDVDFTNAGFVSPQIPAQLFQVIQRDEAAHATFLEVGLQVLGQRPLAGCSFDFTPLLTDVATMASAARIIENVGVGAYLGGAALLTEPAFVDAAATILTIEARHQTVLNILNSGSAIPQAFDIGLSPSEVLAIAGQFISGCDLGIPANPILSITNTGEVAPGTLLTFSSPALNSSSQALDLHCQMLLGGMPFSIALPLGECVVPTGVNGPVVLFVTRDSQPLLNNVIDRGTSQVVAGPTIAFIDTEPEMLGALVRNAGNPGSQAATTTTGAVASLSTTTISPDQAQSLLSSLSATSSTTSATSTSTSTATPDAAAAAASTSTSASASSSAAAPAVTPPSNNAPPAPQGSTVTMNTFTGPVDGGSINVEGFTNVPASAVPVPASQ